MLDAIRNNTDWCAEFKANGSHDDLTLSFDAEHVSISVPDLGTHIFQTSDPKTLRSLAGVLVSWSNKLEGLDPTATEMAAAMRLFGWTDAAFNSDPVNETRLNWYVKNVPLMTPKTMFRHFNDLRVLAKHLDGNQLYDVNRSIDVLWVAMRKTGLFDMNPERAEVKFK